MFFLWNLPNRWPTLSWSDRTSFGTFSLSFPLFFQEISISYLISLLPLFFNFQLPYSIETRPYVPLHESSSVFYPNCRVDVRGYLCGHSRAFYVLNSQTHCSIEANRGRAPHGRRRVGLQSRQIREQFKDALLRVRIQMVRFFNLKLMYRRFMKVFLLIQKLGLVLVSQLLMNVEKASSILQTIIQVAFFGIAVGTHPYISRVMVFSTWN